MSTNYPEGSDTKKAPWNREEQKTKMSEWEVYKGDDYFGPCDLCLIPLPLNDESVCSHCFIPKVIEVHDD